MKESTLFTALFTAVLAVIIIISLRLLNNKNEVIEQLNSAVAEKNAIITYHKNLEGKLVAQKDAAELQAKDLKKIYPEIYNALRQELNVKTNDLKVYIKSEIKAVGSGEGEITNNYYTTPAGERKEYTTFSMDDGYLQMQADIFDSLTAKYSYSYSDTIQQAISTKKKWFLGKEQLYGSATLSNKNAKVVNSQNILIKDYKDKRFGLGVGVLYDPFTTSFHLGVGIQYNLIKF
jgi:hypothetical protein